MGTHEPVAANPPVESIAPALACGNCGVPLQGPYCHACGQPVKGMIRHLASVMADIGDTLFNVDSRIFRTLVPLYLRPGFLTNEYLAGRRTLRHAVPAVLLPVHPRVLRDTGQFRFRCDRCGRRPGHLTA